MSAVQPLMVPAPELAFDPPGAPAELEKPLTIRLAPVRFPDSQEVPPDATRTVGALIYRGAPGSEEVWDEEHQSWTTAPADPSLLAGLKPLPFTPVEGDPKPWKGTLVAVGQKDAAGNARYAKAVSGTPTYRVRASVHAVRDGVDHRDVGPPSPDLQFVSATERQRFAVSLDPDDAQQATRARMVLRNAALQPAGYLEIRATGGQEVDIANCDPAGAVLARVTLSSEGDIHLVPASGRQIVLAGRLEAQEIAYQPSGGGPRDVL